MTNETNVQRSRRSDSGVDPLQTRANTIVKSSDHETPLELSDITIRYGGG
jgi:ribulose 1,5-bisphosphate synthetase/thiazole synthase